jgi:Rrf2 family protein
MIENKTQIIRNETDYAIRMLLYLATKQDDNPVSALTLSKSQKVPLEFAHKILRKLAKANIVKSYSGRNGGYILAVDPKQIDLLSALELVQGPLVLRVCLLNDDACPGKSSCPVSARLKILQENIHQSLKNLTLAEIISTRQTR